MQLKGKVNAFSYKTPFHKSSNKVEITDDDYIEGVEMVKKACAYMKRIFSKKYINFLSRNWCQVKYSDVIICIEKIILPNESFKRGSTNKTKKHLVDGGAGYAVVMGILSKKPIFVFDHYRNIWLRYSYDTERFIKSDMPSLEGYYSFAGIGTSTINKNGENAIIEFFEKNKTFFDEKI